MPYSWVTRKTSSAVVRPSATLCQPLAAMVCMPWATASSIFVQLEPASADYHLFRANLRQSSQDLDAALRMFRVLLPGVRPR